MSQDSKIEVINREGWRKEYPLTKGIVYIGSAPTNDIVLASIHGGGVAPLHAQLIANHSGYKLINLSDADIELGQQTLPPRAVIDVSDGQYIKLGDFTLVFRGSGAARGQQRPGGAAGTSSRSIGVDLSMPFTQLAPHQSLEGIVMVRNLGGRTGVRFEVDLEGLEEECYNVAPGPLLSSGAEKDVLFHIHHRGIKPLAGEWNIVIRVTAPRGYPGEQVVVSQRIEVLPYFRHRARVLLPGEQPMSLPSESFLTPKAVETSLQREESTLDAGAIAGRPGEASQDWWETATEAQPLPQEAVRLQARPPRKPGPSQSVETPLPPIETPAEAQSVDESGETWSWETKEAVDRPAETKPVIIEGENGDWGWETEEVAPQVTPPLERAAQVERVMAEPESSPETGQSPAAQVVVRPTETEQKKSDVTEAPTEAVEADEAAASNFAPSPEDQWPLPSSEEQTEPDMPLVHAMPDTPLEDEEIPASPEVVAPPAQAQVISPEKPAVDEASTADSPPLASDLAAAERLDEAEPQAGQATSTQPWWGRFRQWLPFARQTSTAATLEPEAEHQPPPQTMDAAASTATEPVELLETDEGLETTEGVETALVEPGPPQPEPLVSETAAVSSEDVTPVMEEQETPETPPQVEAPFAAERDASPSLSEEEAEPIIEAAPEAGLMEETHEPAEAHLETTEEIAAQSPAFDSAPGVDETRDVQPSRSQTQFGDEMVEEVSETEIESEEWGMFEDETPIIESRKVIKLRADTASMPKPEEEGASKTEDWWSADT